jgi:hypothetical protein
VLAVGSGCGDEESDGVVLLGAAEWQRDPGSVAEVGYHVQPQVNWVSRAGSCARIPTGLRVTVNDLEAKVTGWRGACDGGRLFDAGPFTTPDPVTVRAFDGDRLLGEATFDDLFWGMRAGLVSPPDGQVRPGDQVVVSVPPGKDGTTFAPYASWYWLGAATAVPPFYTLSLREQSADGSTMTVTVPDIKGLSGPVALAIKYGQEAMLAATTCAGFRDCSLIARYTLGPIPLTVLAP